MQRHHDLIKSHAERWATFIRQRATLQLTADVTDKCVYEGFFEYYAIRRKISCAAQMFFFWHRMPADDPYEALSLFILIDYSMHIPIETLAMKQSIF